MIRKEIDKLFIEKLTDPKSDTFLNQTASYKAIHPNANGCAQPNASRLMDKPEIQSMFIENMRKHGLHDDNVNKHHSKVLEHGDDTNVLKAVRMYHELKGRLGQHQSKPQTVGQVLININVRGNGRPSIDTVNTSDINDELTIDSTNVEDADVEG